MNKLNDYILKISLEMELNYYDSLKLISNKIATIELMPYHSSKHALSKKTFNKLNSPQVALSYVRNVLVPRARNNAICIIVPRQTKYWILADH